MPKKKSKLQPPPNYPQSIQEGYDLIVKALLSDDKELVNKAWKFIQEAPGDWVWVRTKLIVDCYESADAYGKEEFCQMNMNEHIENGTALALAEIFADEETGIEYQEYLMYDGTIYRIPIVTPEMSKQTFDTALNKKFVGDFIKTHSADDVRYTLLDSQEKVSAYNAREYYEKYVYAKRSKKKDNC